MNGTNYVVLGYVLGLALLWGYAATLWVASCRISRSARRSEASEEREG